ncbi:MAG: hypothetical protein LBL47_01485 [Lactobacillus sp.]|nr:hypothetical protein [Lactobacillus sp.]
MFNKNYYEMLNLRRMQDLRTALLSFSGMVENGINANTINHLDETLSRVFNPPPKAHLRWYRQTVSLSNDDLILYFIKGVSVPYYSWNNRLKLEKEKTERSKECDVLLVKKELADFAQRRIKNQQIRFYVQEVMEYVPVKGFPKGQELKNYEQYALKAAETACESDVRLLAGVFALYSELINFSQEVEKFTKKFARKHLHLA